MTKQIVIIICTLALIPVLLVAHLFVSFFRPAPLEPPEYKMNCYHAKCIVTKSKEYEIKRGGND